ncbi:MAG: hypothetical protein K2W82_04985 [Candidatus Obscuribacterales bacterium]|nr:hypothetical protein [Candidatus Obscuribacterales bacterium]
MTGNLPTKSALKLLCAAILFFSVNFKADATSGYDEYLRRCEEIVAGKWRQKAGNPNQASTFLRYHGKSVLTFNLDSKGHINKICLRHSVKESLWFNPKNRFGEKAEQEISQADQSCLQALLESTPLPLPPSSLGCPRKLALVYDPDRFNPFCLMIDDGIANASNLLFYFP